MKSYSGILNLMLKSAEKAYSVLQRDYGEIEFLQSSKKGSIDFATKTVNKIISIVTNNLSSNSKSNNYFDLDGNFFTGDEEANQDIFIGIDGMNNFEHSIPFFSLVIGLINNEKKLDIALVYCPILLEYYVVERGKGAWKKSISGFNSENLKLKVSERLEHNNLLGSSSVTDRRLDNNILYINAESISIAYVATGKLDFHYLSNRPFFQLLAELFMNEAGGIFSKSSNIISNANFR